MSGDISCTFPYAQGNHYRCQGDSFGNDIFAQYGPYPGHSNDPRGTQFLLGIPHLRPSTSASVIPYEQQYNHITPETLLANPVAQLMSPTSLTSFDGIDPPIYSPKRRVPKFKCPSCPRMFDRMVRAMACHNGHLQSKPNACNGACGNPTCSATYGSLENLNRHIRPPERRKSPCPYCQTPILKQNIARHKTICRRRCI